MQPSNPRITASANQLSIAKHLSCKNTITITIFIAENEGKKGQKEAPGGSKSIKKWKRSKDHFRKEKQLMVLKESVPTCKQK